MPATAALVRPQIASAAVVTRAQAALRKSTAVVKVIDSGNTVGNPWHDEGTGKFTSGQGGGGSAGGGRGPFGRQIEVTSDDLKARLTTYNALLRSGNPANDPDVVQAQHDVENLQIKLRALNAQRASALAQQNARPGQGQPYSAPITPRVYTSQAASQAERFAEQHNRIARASNLSSQADQILQSAGFTTGGMAPRPMQMPSAPGLDFALPAGGTRGSNLRQATGQAMLRAGAVATHAARILAHGHAITSTTDLAVVGQRLNAIRQEVGQLTAHARSVPADVRALGTAAGKAQVTAHRAAISGIKRVRNQLGSLSTRLGARIKAMRNK